MKKSQQYKQRVANKITDLDIKSVYQSEFIYWEFFRGKTFYITGATGVVGSFLIRCLRHANKYSKLNLKIVAGVRDVDRALAFFKRKKSTDDYKFIKSDVTEPIKYKGKIDYIIHCANNTSSKSFVEDPDGTYNVAVNGTKNILDFAKEKKVKSVVYLSSMEVYGDIKEPKPLKENELGDLDIKNPRSSYPMGKRAAEELCYSYAKEYNLPVKVARLAQIIGANVDYEDSRVYAQFARSIVEKQDIILNTPAESIRSNCYITDAITAILAILIDGNYGECYNVSSDEPCSVKNIAQMLTEKYSTTKLVFDLQEGTIYPPQSHWILDNSALKNLGWSASTNLSTAYDKLISSFYYQKDKIEKEKEKQKLGIKEEKIRPKYTFLEQIFSLKNDGKYKVIKILGVPFKIDLAIFLKSYYKLPIQENKIVFANFDGSGYGCNPKYIAEEIIKRGLDYDLVWLAKRNANTEDIPPQFRVVNFSSRHALKELITAKVWIDNYRKIFHLKKGLVKRPEQIYIQTWHGSLGIKKLDADVKAFNVVSNQGWLFNAKNEAKMINYLISNSVFDDTVLAPALWYHNEVKQFGHPRNDIFYKDNEKIIKKVRDYYDISKDTNIFLYIPSFRDDGDISWYNIDYQNTLDSLKKRFGGDWIFMVRQHPRVAKMKVNLVPQDDKNIIDATFYSDIQELLVSADIAMSDYSSCIFDFMLSRKPAFIYATDIEKYNTERGFYYPLEATPFPVATNNTELAENIKNFDCEKYKIQVEEFLKGKGCMEDGKASERVVDLIEDTMGEVHYV